MRDGECDKDFVATPQTRRDATRRLGHVTSALEMMDDTSLWAVDMVIDQTCC